MGKANPLTGKTWYNKKLVQLRGKKTRALSRLFLLLGQLLSSLGLLDS